MSGRLLRWVCTGAAVGALLATAPPVYAAPGPGRLGERPVAELLTDLQDLYRKAEEATETYNATEEKLKEQRAEVTRLDRGLAKARASVHDSRGDAGRFARQQYQGTAPTISPLRTPPAGPQSAAGARPGPCDRPGRGGTGRSGGPPRRQREEGGGPRGNGEARPGDPSGPGRPPEEGTGTRSRASSRRSRNCSPPSAPEQLAELARARRRARPRPSASSWRPERLSGASATAPSRRGNSALATRSARSASRTSGARRAPGRTTARA